jgi:hypothetical protein
MKNKGIEEALVATSTRRSMIIDISDEAIEKVCSTNGFPPTLKYRDKIKIIFDCCKEGCSMDATVLGIGSIGEESFLWICIGDIDKKERQAYFIKPGVAKIKKAN